MTTGPYILNGAVFDNAAAEELTDILKLYREASGSPGCTWNEYYPSGEELQKDFSADGLYVLRKGGGVIGALSEVSENELDGLDCWQIRDGSQREIARVCISRENQGNGYAKAMLLQMFAILCSKGCSAIHILVACDNAAAVRTYRSLGFDFLAECFMYGNRYFACEKLLGSPRQ